MDKKYMILCVAGQSNAVGFDESAIPGDYLEQFRTDRIRQLGVYGEDNLKIIPLGACAQNFQDLRPFGNPESDPSMPGTRGMHLPLAEKLLDRIPEDYDILVLPCAYGGVGFTVGEAGSYDAKTLRPSEGRLRWGKASPFYFAMRDRISYALDLNPENRFLGLVWLQGEFDYENGKGQMAGFDAMTEDFLRFFAAAYPGRVYQGNWDRNIWYNVETVAYWYGMGDCPKIWAHYAQWNPETYVTIPRSTDSNEVNGTGLTAAVRAMHFGNDAFRKVVAPRIAEVMAKRLSVPSRTEKNRNCSCEISP